jgi:stringent starvation protein B
MAFDVSTTAAELAPPASAPEPASAPAASAPGLSAVPGKTSSAPASEVSHLPDGDNEPPKKGGRPTLTRIK